MYYIGERRERLRHGEEIWSRSGRERWVGPTGGAWWRKDKYMLIQVVFDEIHKYSLIEIKGEGQVRLCERKNWVRFGRERRDVRERMNRGWYKLYPMKIDCINEYTLIHTNQNTSCIWYIQIDTKKRDARERTNPCWYWFYR